MISSKNKVFEVQFKNTFISWKRVSSLQNKSYYHFVETGKLSLLKQVGIGKKSQDLTKYDMFGSFPYITSAMKKKKRFSNGLKGFNNK